VVEGDIREQTRQAICSLVAIIESAGGSVESIVRVTFFISDWADFSEMNEICAEEFGALVGAESDMRPSSYRMFTDGQSDSLARQRWLACLLTSG